MDLTNLQIQPAVKKKKGLQMLKPVLSVGPELEHLEADRNIPSDPLDNRKRRTIRLQKKNDTWGFTIQTYGFKNKKTGEIEVYTYVDYVDLNGPAGIAGMRRGDIILSVNGKSVEFATHQELVSVIQSCENEARMVVFFVDCCKKVELHDRLIKLKRLLNEKIKELRNVEAKERELLDELCLTRGMDRYDHSRQSIYSIQSNESSLDRLSIITANSSAIYNIPNTVTLHFNTASSTASKSSNDDQSDSADEGDMFADVSFADDSDGDSGYSNDEFPHLQRKNTVIEVVKPCVQVRGRRGTLVAPVCECVEDSICQFCEERRKLDLCAMPLEEDSSKCHNSRRVSDELPLVNPDEDHIPGTNKQCSAGFDDREEMTPTNLDQIQGPSKLEHSGNEDFITANPDESNTLEQCFPNDKSSLANSGQVPESDTPNSNDWSDESDSCTSSPAGQETQHQDSPQAVPGDDEDETDWDFPFWTEGAICINLDDEETKF